MPEDEKPGDDAPADAADDRAGDEPITPEVVPQRGSTYVRRGLGAVRLAALGLVIFGLLLGFQAASVAFDPEGSVCDYSRFVLDHELDRANGDVEEEDEEPSEALVAARERSIEGINSEDDIKDLPCEAEGDELGANQRAALVDELDDSFQAPDETFFRNFGLILLAVSALQLVGGALLMRQQTRQLRWLALAGAIIGILESAAIGLGIIGMAVFIAIIYGLVYSADARATFGHPGGRPPRPRPAGGGLFGPRPRSGSVDTEGREEE